MTMAADGQVIFEISADKSKIDTAIGAVTKTIEDEGKKWDEETKKNTDNMAGSFGSMSDKVSTSITNITGKILNLATKGINKMMDYSDAVDKGSKSIGISAKAYQELDYAMSMSGANIDTLIRGSNNLSNALRGSGTKEVKDALSNLGISNADLKSMSSMEELLDTVMYQLAGLDDQAQRSNIANAIFGIGAGSQLAAFLSEGESGIKKLRKEAEDLGIVQSDEAISQAVKTKDSIDSLNKTLDAVLMQAIEPLIPLIQELVPVIKVVADILTRIIHFLTHGSDTTQEERLENNLFGNFSQEQMGQLQEYVNAYNEYQGKVLELNKLWESGVYFGDEYDKLVSDLEADEKKMNELYGIVSKIEDESGKNLLSSYMTYNNENNQNNPDLLLDVPVRLLTDGVQDDLDNQKFTAVVDLYPNYNGFPTGGQEGSGAVGSHANGLDYVPYDGYFAMLHQGERIQTAAEADLSRRYGNQAPGVDYGAVGGAIRAGMGSMQIIWHGRVVADVLSEQQGDSFRALERSGWQS
jgi:hypothetical protein